MPPLLKIQKDKSWFTNFVIYITTLFIIFLLFITSQVLLTTVVNAPSIEQFIFFVFIQIIGILIIIYVLKKDPYNEPNKRLTTPFKNFVTYVLYPYIVIFALVLVNGFLVEWIMDLFALNEITTNNQENLEGIAGRNKTLWIYVVMYSILAAPIIEEFFFRYLAIGSISQTKGWLYFRAVVAAIVFALIHVNVEAVTLWSNPTSENLIFFGIAFLTYFSMSAVFTIVYLITGKLRYSIAVHMLNNTIAALISFF